MKTEPKVHAKSQLFGNLPAVVSAQILSPLHACIMSLIMRERQSWMRRISPSHDRIGTHKSACRHQRLNGAKGVYQE